MSPRPVRLCCVVLCNYKEGELAASSQCKADVLELRIEVLERKCEGGFTFNVFCAHKPWRKEGSCSAKAI